jgi:hypothetical protein
MSYNTKFKVKYNDIEKELINKLKHKTLEEYEKNPDEEYEYDNQDIIDICSKLYRDELLSVFEAEDLVDEKIDKGMIYVYDIMMKNEAFKDIILKMENVFTETFYTNEQLEEDDPEKINRKESFKQLCLISFFSQDMFYNMHKCICQQIEVGHIDEELLVELRKLSIDVLQNNFGV